MFLPRPPEQKLNYLKLIDTYPSKLFVGRVNKILKRFNEFLNEIK